MATLRKHPISTDRREFLKFLAASPYVAAFGGVAAFLASSDADYITGATIVVDGGLTWNYSEQ